MSTFPTPSAARLAVEHELFLLGHRNLQAHVFGQGGLSLLVAMGAWKRISAQHAEIKSMHVLAEARGRGVAWRIDAPDIRLSPRDERVRERQQDDIHLENPRAQ